MNTRDLAQQKAFEMLEELNLDPDAKVYGCSILTIATSAFMRGWVHGLQDSTRIRKETLNAVFGELGNRLLKPQAG